MESNIVLQVGVKILLQNKDGNYLLLRRSLEKYSEIQGRWDIVGGRINPGETLLDSLKREIKEEISLVFEGLPTLIAAQDIIRNNGRHVVRLTYVGKIDGEVILDTEENDMFKWYTFDELKSLDDLDIYFKELLNNELLWKDIYNKK